MSEGDQTNRWQVQEAKARFSTLVDTALENGPQIVTKRGVDAVVVVPYQQWLNLERQEEAKEPKYKNIKEWLLAPEARTENLVPPEVKDMLYGRRSSD